MKTMTKAFGVLVASLVLAMSLSLAAFAGGETGTINITNAKTDQTYTIYQVLDLESYDASSEAYAYKAVGKWADFVKQADINGTYVNVDGQGYVTWVKGANTAEFAKLAKAYAVDNNIANQGQITATSSTISFTDLDLGYYLLDSSLGALCALDTTNPTVTLEEKNLEPGIEKKVNRGGEAYGDSNTANIGDVVTFRTVVTAEAGAENYVVHDKMSAGLTFIGIPETVTVGTSTEPGIYWRHSGTDTSQHTMTEGAGNDYTVVKNPGDGCTFHVVFTADFLKSITSKTYINIHYTAQLNENAVVGEVGNDNQSKLTYGDNQTTVWDKTQTFTYKFDLVKINSSKKILSGATFKLYDQEQGGDEIALVSVGDGAYRVATPDEKKVEGFTGATITAGTACIQGLANGTYYLEEINAPAGYNKLDQRKAVVIADADNEATLSADGTMYTSGGVSVTNNTGSILPSTGDMGTTVFVLVGGLLIISACVILIARSRSRARK